MAKQFPLIHYTVTQTGCDPEFFFEDDKGQVIPAWEVLLAKPENREVFWDGFQAEFCPQAGSCKDGLGSRIHYLLKDIKTQLHKKFPTARFSWRSTVEVTGEQLARATDAQVAFGCAPSHNAYGLKGEAIENPRALKLRFAGGHIHFSGFTRGAEWPANAAEIVKTMDAAVGLLGVSMAEGMDDSRRRRYYGLAGEHRLPPHGLEYRVLSNFWLCANPAVYHLVLDIARHAANIGAGHQRRSVFTAPEGLVVRAIQDNDPKLARELMIQDKDSWLWMLNSLYGSAANWTWERLLRPLRELPVVPEDWLWNWEHMSGYETYPLALGRPETGRFVQRWRTFYNLSQNAWGKNFLTRELAQAYVKASPKEAQFSPSFLGSLATISDPKGREALQAYAPGLFD